MSTILALAPMYDVTDYSFREIIADIGKPDLMYTEFVNVEALTSAGRESQLQKLKFSKKQGPVYAQIWGCNPDNYFTIAKELVEMGFAGIDINMGCPQKDVLKTGSCAALINNHDLAKEIIDATLKGAGNLPVSVKTRLGVKEYQTDEWVNFLLSFDISTLTIHGRTVKQLSKVPANWEEIHKAVQIRDVLKSKTNIFGNGDVMSYAQANDYAERYGVDGVMIGRGIFTNLGIFAQDKAFSKKERLDLLVRHAKMFETEKGVGNSFYIMRKYFKIYVRDFDGSSELRAKLMETDTAKEVEDIIGAAAVE